MRIGFWPALMFVFVVCSVASAAERPNLLMIGKRGRYMEVEYLEELRRHGIEFESVLWEEVSPGMLRRYNAVVVTAHTVPGDSQWADRTRRRWIDTYMRKGGGVLVLMNTTGTYKGDKKFGDYMKWLAGYGLDWHVEAIEDRERDTVLSPPDLNKRGKRAAWTDDVRQHPVTEDVKSIWYPVGWGGHFAAQASQVDVGSPWKVVLRTGPDAQAAGHAQIPEDWWRKDPPGGPYNLMAVRPVENGRLAVLGLDPVMTVWTPKHYSLGEAIFRKGENGRPSDLWRLLENTYRWLAEPSMNMGIYGPKVALYPPVPRETPPVAWEQLEFPGTVKTWYRGVCGAHTALSTGKGTVAEWVDAAKRAGLDFLIFTEDLAHMNAGKWQKLQSACEAASDENFVAYPGIEYRNARGNRGFMPLGGRDWPVQDGYLTADGKRVNVSRGYDPDVGHVVRDSSKRSGQIQMWLENKVNGYLSHEQNEAPFWDYKLYNLFTVWSAERTEPLDRALGKFLHANSLHVNPAPYALDLLYDPADLSSVLEENRPHLVVAGDSDPRQPDEPNLRNVFYRYVVSDMEHVEYRQHAGGYRGWIGPVATQGPKARLMFRAGYRWKGIEYPRYWIERYAGIQHEDWFMPSWYRLKLRTDAESEVGLDRVALYDGERLFRRYDPDGAERFSIELDVTQNQNRHLALVVTDREGRQAVTREIWTEQQQNLYNFCGDRVNNPNSIYSPIHGHVHHRYVQKNRTRAIEKRRLFRNYRHDEARRFFVDLVSPDLFIERYVTDWVYDPEEVSDLFGWHNWAPHYERKDYTLMQRAFGWYDRHGEEVSYRTHHSQNVSWDGYKPTPRNAEKKAPPAALVAFEHEMTLKKPQELDEHGFLQDGTIVLSQDLEAAPECRYGIVRPDGTEVSGPFEDLSEPASGGLPSGSVVVFDPGEGQIGHSIRWVGEDLGYRIETTEDGQAVLKTGVQPGERNRAGEKFRWRFQRMRRAVSIDQLRDPDWFEVHAGSVDALTLSELHVRADAGVADVTISRPAADTNCQPVVVHGINPKTTAALYMPETGAVRPIGVWDGKAYAQFDAALAPKRLVVGNLLRVNHEEVTAEMIRLTDRNGRPTGRWLIDIHNPTDGKLSVALSVPPQFDLIEKRSGTVELEPFGSKKVQWE